MPDLKEFYDSTPYIKQLLETAKQVEGVTRHASTHAAGILVSDKPLTEYLPLNRPPKGDVEDSPVDRVSQWPMEIVDAMGMLKVDFLGLRTLTHMRKTCEWIEKSTTSSSTPHTIPYERVPDDPGEGRGGQEALRPAGDRARRPASSRSRAPGCAGRCGICARSRIPAHHRGAGALPARPDGQHPDLHPPDARGGGGRVPPPDPGRHPGRYLRDHRLPGADYADRGGDGGLQARRAADMIRKAVAKKKKKLMVNAQEDVPRGRVKKGIAPRSPRVWADIEFFARYGFNRAHATDYAVITAQTAYLKAHYPGVYDGPDDDRAPQRRKARAI